MMNPVPQTQKFRFASFELDLTAGEMAKSGIRLRLGENPLQVLATLVERPGESHGRAARFHEDRLFQEGVPPGVNAATTRRDFDFPDTAS